MSVVAAKSPKASLQILCNSVWPTLCLKYEGYKQHFCKSRESTVEILAINNKGKAMCASLFSSFPLCLSFILSSAWNRRTMWVLVWGHWSFPSGLSDPTLPCHSQDLVRTQDQSFKIGQNYCFSTLKSVEVTFYCFSFDLFVWKLQILKFVCGLFHCHI